MAEVFSKQTVAEQLAERLRGVIEDGIWPAGSRVPSIRKLAEDYDVSPNTAHAALRELEDAHLLERQPSGGAFVSEGLKGSQVVLAKHSSSRSEKSPTSLMDPDAPDKQDMPKKFSHIAMVGPLRPGDWTGAGNDWMGRIFLAAETELARTGLYSLTRVCSMEGPSDQSMSHVEAQIDHLSSHLSGAVLFSIGTRKIHRQIMEKMDRAGVPWVSINRPGEDVMHNFVSADNLSAGKTVARCLMLENIKRILVLSPDLSHSVSQTQKVTGLIESYLHHNKSISGIEYVPCHSAVDEYGYKAAQDYLRNHQPPQVIYATGDYLAAGAMRACQDAGLNVPDDVSIIGSTGLDMAQYTSPALTVIPQPMEAMGQAAGEMLIRMIQTGERRLAGRHIPSKLVLRDSLKISEQTRKKLREEGLIEVG